MEIIHLSPERWSEYRDIYLEELKNEPAAFINSYEKIKELGESHWIEILKERSEEIYFVQENGKIIGMAGYTPGEYEKNAHTANLWGVYVQPGFREKGYAKILIEKILDDLRSKNFVKLGLGVVDSQKAARELYKKLGFREVGVFEKEVKVGEKFFDEYEMEKILN